MYHLFRVETPEHDNKRHDGSEEAEVSENLLLEVVE